MRLLPRLAFLVLTVVALLVGGAADVAAQPKVLLQHAPAKPVVQKPLALSTVPVVLATTLASLTLSTNNVLSNDHVSGTVTLNGAAPAAGAIVTLTSTNHSHVGVEPTVTIPAGATSQTFSLYVPQAGAACTETVTATYQAASRSAQLTVRPVVVTSLTVDATTLSGGNTATATVTLAENAPSSGAAFNIGNTNPSALGTPQQVGFAPGQRTGTFAVTAKSVTAATYATPEVGGKSSASIQINPPAAQPPAIANVTAPTAVNSGGVGVMGVTFANAATGAVTIALSSSNPALVTFSRATAGVGVGSTSSGGQFTVGSVRAPTTVTLTATSGASTRSINVTVNPPRISSLTFDHPVFGEYEAWELRLVGITATVTLEGPAPPEGLDVQLDSSDPRLAVPTVNVPAGQRTGKCVIRVAGGQGAGDYAATLSAKGHYGPRSNLAASTYGPVQATGAVAFHFRTITDVTISPKNAPVAGTKARATAGIFLDSRAPPGGIYVRLALSQTTAPEGPSATIPAGVTVPEGSQSAEVPLEFNYLGASYIDPYYVDFHLLACNWNCTSATSTIMVPASH